MTPVEALEKAEKGTAAKMRQEGKSTADDAANKGLQKTPRSPERGPQC